MKRATLPEGQRCGASPSTEKPEGIICFGRPIKSTCEWFTEKRLPGDVTLKFDDGKELFASREFLMYASPVFEAMFEHNMKEKETNVVTLTDKQYDHVLELLMCLHPRVAKPVTRENVMYLTELAQEYQITALLEKSKEVLRIWMLQGGRAQDNHFRLSIPTVDEACKIILQDANKTDKYSSCTLFDILNKESVHALDETSNVILKILSLAITIHDEPLVSEAIKLLSFINVSHLTRSIKMNDVVEENQAIIDRFDDKIKLRIYQSRATNRDNEDWH